MKNRNTLVLAVLSAFVLGGFAPVLPAQDAPGKAPEPLLSRVATIGASLTGGFGNTLPLSTLMERAITEDHTRVLRCFTFLFFQRPLDIGHRQIDRCLKHEPTLVLAVDFLFWYGYGFVFSRKGERAFRLERLEKGLAQLDRLACPVVVGDLPDMTGAHPWMLSPYQVPSPEVQKALNQRIRTWAAGKPNVLVVPLADWVRGLKTGAWKIPGSAPGQASALTPELALIWDRLHPTRVGALFLTEKLVALMRSHFGDRARSLELDAMETIRALGLEACLQGEEAVAPGK